MDDPVDTKDMPESTSTSHVTFIAADVRRGIGENGRVYAAYGQYKSWIPVDDTEVRIYLLGWAMGDGAPYRTLTSSRWTAKAFNTVNSPSSWTIRSIYPPSILIHKNPRLQDRFWHLT